MLGFWLDKLCRDRKFTLSESRDILRQRDEHGNTALHIALSAASRQRGSRRNVEEREMCRLLEVDATTLVERMHAWTYMYMFDPDLEQTFPSSDGIGFVQYVCTSPGEEETEETGVGNTCKELSVEHCSVYVCVCVCVGVCVCVCVCACVCVCKHNPTMLTEQDQN